MKRVVLAGIIGGLLLVPALASSFDDFNHGIAASNRGDGDAAVQYLSAALSAGDLLPSAVPIAYFDRGVAYESRRQFDNAISDFSSAIRLNPTFIEGYVHRTRLLTRAGQSQSALGDCSKLASLAPNSLVVLQNCGQISWLAGQYDDSGKQFAQALAITHGSSPYFALWLALSRMKAGHADDAVATEALRGAASRGWSGKLVDLYRGRVEPDEVLTAAVNEDDPPARRDRRCEAGFYVGEWYSLRGDTAKAKPLLQQAADTCSASYWEYVPAAVELGRIK